MRHLTFGEVIALHRAVIAQTGGADGLRDAAALDSALAQPKVTFDGQELYTALEEEAGALGFSLAQNHPFVDGNKRVAHATMETFLVLNKAEIDASVEEQERLMLDLASGGLTRDALIRWLRDHVRPLP